MNNMWLYLKENVKCGSRFSDVICIPERCKNKRDLSSEETVLDRQIVHPLATPIRELIFRQNHSQTWLYELENGNSSRKIVEMIFQKAWTNPLTQEKRIKSVLKVKNSVQSLEWFEKYREKVKMYTQHPRGAVDGNELLRFYGTTMTCRSKRSRRASGLCKDYACRVCRILQSNFSVEYRLGNGLWLSSCSENATKTKYSERAVIVCRTIAGSSVCVNRSECNESHSLNSGNVIMHNPNAVLPCFVIIYN